MTLVDLDEAQLSVLRSVLQQAEIPHPQAQEQEVHTEETLDFSGFATSFHDLNVDLSIAGLDILSLDFASREKKKVSPSPSTTPQSVPYKTLILIAGVLATILLVGSLTTPVASHNASTGHTTKQVSVGRATGERVIGGPTITARYIDTVLCGAHSSACGTGQALYDDGVQAHIDPAFALAFFGHESSYGTAGMAVATHSLGNMRCMDGYGCLYSSDGGYASFPDWNTGYIVWYRLINDLYVQTWGLTTVEQIIPRYAPSSDHNDEAAYIASVEASVAMYRQEGGRV